MDEAGLFRLAQLSFVGSALVLALLITARPSLFYRPSRRCLAGLIENLAKLATNLVAVGSRPGAQLPLEARIPRARCS